MANIEILHEAALLTNLLSRYEKRQIYTRIGKEMIVMNPY